MKGIFLALFFFVLAASVSAQEESAVTVDVKPPEGKKATVKDVLEYFADEPTIQDVQAAAIEYAEVHPDKILKWRRKAKYKAIAPTVSFDWQITKDEQAYDRTEHAHREEQVDRVLGFDLDWDLSDLIWNSAQTSIDVRSKLMVQLRNDVLDEVTRTYFERRRLQVEMLLSPPEDMKERIEQELRIQELTADIDALTGGYLSRKLKDVKEKKEKQTK